MNFSFGYGGSTEDSHRFEQPDISLFGSNSSVTALTYATHTNQNVTSSTYFLTPPSTVTYLPTHTPTAFNITSANTSTSTSTLPNSLKSTNSTTSTITPTSTNAPTSTPTTTLTKIITSTPSPTQAPSSTNDDYGNNMLSVHPAAEKTNIEGVMETSYDVDVFSISSKLDCDIVISLSNTENISKAIMDYRGYIIEPQSTFNTYEGDGIKTFIKFHTLKDMKYYLKLTNCSDDVKNYSFNYEYLIDDYSDAFADANAISLGETITGNIINDDDVDTFRFKAANDGVYSLNYTKTECSLSIFDENNNIQNISNDCVQLKNNQVYYIKVGKSSIYQNCYYYNFKISGTISDDYSNTMDNAAEITLENTISGSIDYGTDNDYFSFTPSENGLYFVNGVIKNSYINDIIDRFDHYGIKIFDTDGNKIETTYYNQCLAYTLNKGVKYYILFSTDESRNIYKYSFKIMHKLPDDNDNTINTANGIFLNKPINGVINPSSDIDYYIFRVTKDGTYSISFNSKYDLESEINGFPNPRFIDAVRVYDENGGVLGNGNYYDEWKAYFYFEKDKNYYISISNIRYYPIFNYSLNIEGSITDDFGNTKESSSEIQAGNNVNGKCDYYNDVDYFYFKPTITGTYCLEDYSQIDENNRQNNTWQLYDAYGNPVSTLLNNGILTFSITKDNIYYISLNRNSYNSTPEYSFTLKGPVEDDIGNTINYAKELHINDSVTVVSNYYGDKDYLSLSPLEDGLYYLDMTSSKNIEDYKNYIYIADSNNNLINPSFIDSKMYFSLSKNNKYYICIDGSIYAKSYPDSLSFVYRGPLPDDFGNSKDSSYSVQLNKIVEGFSDSQDDKDYFSFSPTKDGVYRIDYTFLSEYSSDLQYSNLFTTISTNGKSIQASYNNKSAYIDLKKDTTYYLVTNFYNNPYLFKYSFTINLCTDDYGNLSQSASDIKLDLDIKGKLDHYFDCDYFKFTPSVSGAYRLSDIRATYTDDGSYYPAFDSLVGITGTESHLVEAKNPIESEIWFYLYKGNTYYIYLKGPGCLLDYSFKLKGPTPDDFGNTISYSKTIVPGEKVEGKIEFNSDIDFFTFTTPTKGLYCISISNYVNFNISNSNNEFIRPCPINLDSNDHYYYLPANETFYFYVGSDTNWFTDYTLIVKEPVYDDYDNTSSEGTVIKTNTPTKGKINYPGDIDMLQVIPQFTGNIYLKFDAPSNLAMKILDYSDRTMEYETIGNNTYRVDLKDLNNINIKVESYDVLLKGNYTITASENLESLLTSVTSAVYSGSPVIVTSPAEWPKGEVPTKDDFGNNVLDACPIFEKSSISGNLDHYNDIDIFSFIPAVETYTVVEISTDTYEMAPSVLDYRGKPISFEETKDSFASNEFKIYLKFYTSKNMKYFIKLNYYLNNAASYTIKYAQLIDDYADTYDSPSVITCGQKINGNFIDDNDIDVFKFTPKVDGIYKIDYPQYKCAINVVDENLNYQYHTNNYVSLKSGKPCYIAVQKHVDNKASFFYNFEVSVPIKDDFGDSSETAKRIDLDTAVNGSIDHSTDYDYFSFTAPLSGIYQIYNYTTSYNPSPFFDYNLEKCIKVYDSNKNPIEFTFKYAREACLNLEKGKTYFIVLSTVTSTDLIYKYSFTIKSPVVDDIGNSSEYSKEIQLNTLNTGKIGNRFDVDYFKFTPVSDGIYCVEIAPTFDSNMYNKPKISDIIDIHDNGYYICDNDNSKAYIYFKKGTANFISVSGGTGCSNYDYSLIVKGPVADDYGNTIDTSAQIQVGKEIEGKANYYHDSDYFSFTPDKDGVYNFKPNLLNGFTNIWSISNSNGNIISSNTFYPNSFSLKKGELYYIEIIKDIYDSSLNYSFFIEGPFEDDFGDSIESSKECQLNTPITIVPNYLGDNDYISFTASEDGLYQISISSDKNANNLCNLLSLYDSNGIEIYPSRLDSKLYITLKESTYFIRILGNNYFDKYSLIISCPVNDNCGNTKESAQQVQLSADVEELSNSRDDIDFFSFICPNTGMYKLDFKTSGIFNQSIRLPLVFGIFDALGNKVAVSFLESSAFFQLDKDKAYYLSISNNNTTNFYAFDYSFVITGPIYDDHGNTKELSSEMLLNNKVSAEINYPTDLDYFKFTPSISGTYYLDYLPIDKLYTASNLGITDSIGNSIYPQVEYSNGSKVSFTLSKDNTYYIYLSSGSSSDLASYSFILKGPIADDFGNTPSYSGSMGSKNNISGKFDYIRDTDYFSFAVSCNGLYHVSKSENVVISVFDSTNKKINEHPDFISNFENCYYLKSYETYYICTSNSYTSLGTYNIKIDGPLPEDYANTTLGTPPLKVNTPLNSSLNFPGDIDRFKFFSKATDTIYIKFDAPTYFYFQIYNNNSLLEYTYIKDNVYSVNLNESFFTIDVSSYDSALTGDYTISVSDKLENLINATCKVSGYISPEYITSPESPSRAGFTVSLTGTSLSAVTDENGYFDIKDVPMNSTSECEMSISKAGYLKRDIKGVIVDKDIAISQIKSPILMWSGDISSPNDDKINMSDVISLSKVFNSVKGDGVYYESADLNGDSVINIMDVVIMAKHFNQTSSDYPKN
ncbi:hypothetical protein [Pseudobacteroides cellulosolvens]|uniref:Dockerin domain-containing protein n=1 Tax=Pseudobacteroides cellulosolvens ATCC 35603 = DSM 2933 TaxID=398512 RepID=A0A0L6JHJ4_9FIRM|nr:hypothetical protein [Pseudobacteroides cellulosolvens]KNY25311.1 hypothetical protein Bccel_0571 [Pseudobacteroides cellulosolvens ATCC 35603 = DSM 2933]